MSSITAVPSYYTRWLVLFILSNLAAESEEIVDLLLCSDLYKLIIDEMIDEKCNRGLLLVMQHNGMNILRIHLLFLKKLQFLLFRILLIHLNGLKWRKSTYVTG